MRKAACSSIHAISRRIPSSFVTLGTQPSSRLSFSMSLM